LNIAAYLERINYHGSLAPDAKTLRALHWDTVIYIALGQAQTAKEPEDKDSEKAGDQG